MFHEADAEEKDGEKEEEKEGRGKEKGYSLASQIESIVSTRRASEFSALVVNGVPM